MTARSTAEAALPGKKMHRFNGAFLLLEWLAEVLAGAVAEKQHSNNAE
jgi:hypothetical protein